MKELEAKQLIAPDAISSTFKIFLFVIPPTLVEQAFPQRHWMLFGASFIVGALLQALWPPRTYRLTLILGLAAAAAIAIPVIAHFARWN